MMNVTKYELIALIEAHFKAAVKAGCENNLKGNPIKEKKHSDMIGKLEKALNEGNYIK
jgi:hypothetical protein